jgi:hypothetical protein
MTHRRFSISTTATTGLCLLMSSVVDAGFLVSCDILQGAARYKLLRGIPKGCDRSQCSGEVCTDCIDGGDSISTLCTDGCGYTYNNHTVQRRFFLGDNIVDTMYGDLKWEFNQYTYFFSEPGATTYVKLGWGTCAQTFYSLNIFFAL